MNLLHVLAILSVCTGFAGIAVLVFVLAALAVRRRDRGPCEHCGTRDGHR